MKESHLTQTLKRLTDRSSSSIIAHRRIANRQLNALLLRRLSAGFGQSDSFLASPIFEIAREWKPAPKTFEGFSGDLLHPDLVNALDSASSQKISRELHPHVHQVKAWDAAKNGLSCLVSSGTGSGKTECFMLPIIDDLLNDPKQGRLHGIRAIIVYPLNALIESQRERLSAWTEQLSDRITFALYNGLTPEKRKRVAASLSKAELGDRRSIRDNPPSILITNVTMLEYMLLRPQDQNILKKSQGLLRWIVLDEAHGYIGAQAA